MRFLLANIINHRFHKCFTEHGLVFGAVLKILRILKSQLCILNYHIVLLTLLIQYALNIFKKTAA